MNRIDEYRKYVKMKSLFIEYCQQCNADPSPDEEEAHKKLDTWLLLFIDDDDITEAFQSVNKWYA